MARNVISYYRFNRKRMGARFVECMVSGRGLLFHDGSWLSDDGEWIIVDVITNWADSDRKTRKICELIVSREQLETALRHVTPKE